MSEEQEQNAILKHFSSKNQRPCGFISLLGMSSTKFFQGYQHDTVRLYWTLLGLSLELGPHTDKWPWSPAICLWQF